MSMSPILMKDFCAKIKEEYLHINKNKNINEKKQKFISL